MQMKKFPIMFYIIFNSYYKPEVLDVNNELTFCCKSIKKELNSCYEFI